MPRFPLLLLIGGALAASVAPAAAQSAANVLVVVNESSAESIEIGEYYAKARGVPGDQIVRVAVPVTDEIGMAEYAVRIERPLVAWLMRHAAADRILFLVLAKGVPLRVAGTTGRDGTSASIDSELALLYRKMTGLSVVPQGRVPNPYYLAERPIDQAGRFSHAEHDIFLVTRLDGFTVADVKALIDRGMRARNEGRIVLDMKAAWQDKGNERIQAAADRLAALGLGERTLLENSSVLVSGQTNVLGYVSWGSNDPAMKSRRSGLSFVPGAIATMFASHDARTFAEPPATWTLGAWDRPGSYYAGAPQSLLGDLIRDGVTGVAGHVGEPLLDGVVRPDILLPAYLSGFTLAEAYYLALPFLSWQSVIVGDPLCAIGQRASRPDTEISPEIDPATETSRFFATRRVERSLELSPSLDAEAVRLTLRAEVKLARDERAAAEELLVEATSREPRLVAAHHVLAAAYEQRGEYGRAIERYRAILERAPGDLVALNNLAYALAERERKPEDALPIARRAYTLSRGQPMIADTLAWVLFLTGNVPEAGRYIAQAARGVPGSAEVQLHAAVIFLAGGQIDSAKTALAQALKLDPALASREDVVKVQEKLGAR